MLSIGRIGFVVVLMGAFCAAFVSEAKAEELVSFSRDIEPILRVNCVSCHRADKAKGDLDLSSFAMLMRGGGEGASVVPGKPEASSLVALITGPEPEMPAKGEPLSEAQVELISRWIREGAKDDTGSEVDGSQAQDGADGKAPEVYVASPVIAAMAYSPDGKYVAIGAYHEVVLHHADGSGIAARLAAKAPRIEAIAFSKDGALLAACGGSPGEYGEVQVWDVVTKATRHAYRVGADSLYGLSWSPDGQSVAVGGAEKIVRRLRVSDGEVLLDFRAHGDWVRGVAFTDDGTQLVSAGRDKAMKLIDLATGRFVDDINNPLEPITCLARHPSEAMVVYGGGLGTARVYRISDNQKRTSARNDANLVIAFERLASRVTAVAFSGDGALVAVGSEGEVVVFDATTGERRFSVGEFDGPVFALSFAPDGGSIAAAGFDGRVRLIEVSSGSLIREFEPVPLAEKVSTR